MKSLHRLLNRCVRIEAMALQDVDVFKLEAFQRLLHRIKNVLFVMQSVTKQDTGEETESVHLAAETMLIHVSYLVEFGGRCQVQRYFHRLSDSRVQLCDVYHEALAHRMFTED
jgi:hypothetical protein